MQTLRLRHHLKNKAYHGAVIDTVIASIQDFEKFCLDQDFPQTLDDITAETVQKYMDFLIATQSNTVNILRSMAEYFYSINRHDLYIQMTKYLGGQKVMESIRQRIESVESDETAHLIFDDLAPIPLGTAPMHVPEYTRKMFQRLEKHLPPDRLEVVLAGNNHQVPKDAMLKEKEHYDQSSSLDQYLYDLHQRKVAELQRYCDENKIWYEQSISQEVVDFVKANQEILSAVRMGDYLYVTKIPFDIEKYLLEKDPRQKAYHACHCPFARESILQDGGTISPNWCYCSGGFEKFPFEVVLGKELKVKVLQSALNADPICRFEISLEGVDYKK